MGDFNSNSPTLRGQEWRPYFERLFTFDSPGRGLMMRVKPQTTPRVDLYVERIFGQPGIGVELLGAVGGTDTPLPTQTKGYFPPLTDTGKVTTGWVNESGAALGFGSLSDFNLSTFGTNASQIPASGWLGNALLMEWRLNQGSFAGRRIL